MFGYHSEQLERCECHECTQARWKMSIQGQIEQAFRPARALDSTETREVIKLPRQRSLGGCVTQKSRLGRQR
jgi:hypothetical protein